MLVPALSLVLLAQGQSPFASSQTVDDPLRLALTPILDGVVAEQEWEFFTESDGGRAYFQWEPGKLYWAGKIPNGRDLVLTLDASGDGWLVGKDNLEVRCSLVGSEVRTTVRQLDATDRNGPTWIDPQIIKEAMTVAARPSDGYWNVEVGFEPVMFTSAPAENRRIGLRMDTFARGVETGPAYQPRQLTFSTLRFDTSQGLFSGMTWRPQVKTRSVSRYDPVNFRFTFEIEEDCPPLRSVEIGGEGYAGQALKPVSTEFPAIDGRGRAFVDFRSPVEATAVGGYRVLRASVMAGDGRVATIRTSIRIADLIDFDPNFRTVLPFSTEPQRVKGGVTIQSMALGRVEGRFSIRYPEDWFAIGTLDREFLIYHDRGRSRIPIEFQIPGGVRGVYPVVLSAQLGERSLVETVYVSVGQ